jgi:hypothetical protein
MLAMTLAWFAAGEPAPPAADGFVEAGGARLNLALNLPNVKATLRIFNVAGELPHRHIIWLD